MKLTRYDGNPILSPHPDHDWENLAVFNPAVCFPCGAVVVDGTLMVLMCLVIQQYGRMAAWLAVFVATSVVLKFTWYDRLGPGEMYLVPPAGEPAKNESEAAIGA